MITTKQDFIDSLKSEGFFHGLAMSIADIGDPVVVKKDEVGILTAWLPDEDIFAVDFGKGKWITFKQSKKQFEEMVEVFPGTLGQAIQSFMEKYGNDD